MSLANATDRAKLDQLTGQLQVVTEQLAAQKRKLDELTAAGATPGTLKPVNDRLDALKRTQEQFQRQFDAFVVDYEAQGGRLDALEQWRPDIEARLTHAAHVANEAHGNIIEHDSRLNRLESANGWTPLILGVAAGIVSYVIIEVTRHKTATHIQWAWTVGAVAIVGLLASLLVGRTIGGDSAEAEPEGETQAEVAEDGELTAESTDTDTPQDEAAPTEQMPSVGASAPDAGASRD